MKKIFFPSFIMSLFAASFLFTMPVIATGSISSTNQPTVSDIATRELGNIKVEVSAGSMKKGDVVMISLPEFAEFGKPFESEVKTDFGRKANLVVAPTAFNGNPNWDAADPAFKIKDITKDRIVLESLKEQTLDQSLVFFVQLGDIDIESGAYGAINVHFESSPGSGFPEGNVTVGKVFGERTTFQLASLGFEQKEDILQFKLMIEEDQANAFKEGKPLKLRLPIGFTWMGGNRTVEGQSGNLKIEQKSESEIHITLLDRKGGLQVSAWQVPLQFKPRNESEVESGVIDLDIQWDQSSRLTVGSYLKPVQKEYVTFKVGSSTYTDGDLKSSMDVAPYIREGRTYIPVRYAAEALGVSKDNILWNAVSNKVTILKDSLAIQLELGSNMMNLDGKMVLMDAKVELKDGRVMLPIRYISEAFGVPIIWEEDNQLIKIEKTAN